MTEQPTLFAEPTARRSDPKTSHKAAASARMRAGSQRHRILAAFLITANRNPDPGWTAREVGQLTGLADKPGCSYWTRVSELARDGLIEYTGQTRPVDTGEEQRCYRLTRQGLEVLAAMT